MKDYLRLSPLILPDFTGEMNKIENTSLFHDETHKKHRDVSFSRILPEFLGIPDELHETDDDEQTAEPERDRFFVRTNTDPSSLILRDNRN